MEHFYQNIRGWCHSTDTIYKQQVEKAKDGAHFVEVGACLGKSTAFMAVEIINSKKTIRFDTIDTFLKCKNIENLYERFLENIEPVKHVVNHYKIASIDGSKMYVNNSLDFVYLDANHHYSSIKKDIEKWFPKVKVGGVIAGHDYNLRGVNMAVKEFFINEEIQTTTDKGETGSWLVVKNEKNKNYMDLKNALWNEYLDQIICANNKTELKDL